MGKGGKERAGGGGGGQKGVIRATHSNAGAEVAWMCQWVFALATLTYLSQACSTYATYALSLLCACYDADSAGRCGTMVHDEFPPKEDYILRKEDTELM